MKIPATDFKANCLKLVNRVGKTRERVVITKHGRPIAQLVPANDAPETLFGYMKGTLRIDGDIVAPLNERWSVQDGREDYLYDTKPRNKLGAARKKLTR